MFVELRVIVVVLESCYLLLITAISSVLVGRALEDIKVNFNGAAYLSLAAILLVCVALVVQIDRACKNRMVRRQIEWEESQDVTAKEQTDDDKN